MDPLLMNFIKETTPKMNYKVINGLAVDHLKYSLKYLDDILRNVFKDLLPGLKYVRMVRCSPEEELKKEQRRKNDKLVIDIARSDLFLVGLDFTYVDPTKKNPITGEPDLTEHKLQRRYLFLPFVGPAGSITLAGSRFFINTVLSDIVISYEREGIFVRLLRDKFAVRRIYHTVYCNKKVETIPVLWSEIYHLSKERMKDKMTKVLCPLLLYLLCVYGLKNTIKKFGKADCVVGDKKTLQYQDYPDDQWVVFESSRMLRKRGFKGFNEYVNFRIAIPKEQMNQNVLNIIGTIYYLLDFFPDMFKNIEWLESKEKWMIIMGFIYFGDQENHGIILEDITEHFKSLDEYMDDFIRNKLISIDIHVNDIYDLFGIIIERFGEWMIGTSDKINSLYNKEMSILYDTLFPITSSIFNCYFKLKSAAKNSEKLLSLHDVEKIMKNTIRARAIFANIKNQNALTNVGYSGDNKFFKITCVMNPQKRTTGGRGSDDAGQLEDPEKRLHVSFVDVGNYSNLTGKTPVGSQRVNPYIELDPNGRVLKSQESREALDRTQELIKRM